MKKNRFVPLVAALVLVAGMAVAVTPFKSVQPDRVAFGNGSATLPIVSFANDEDTGIYRAAANTVGIAGSGAAALTCTPGTLALKKSSTTNSITSDTTATAMTSSVAAVTIAPTATPAANDLVFEVNDAAGNSLLSVDVEGDLVTAGSYSFSPADVTLSGGDLTSSHTTQSFNVVSGCNDATTSTTVAAVTVSSSVNVANGDLILAVRNSAADALLTVDEQGLTTALTDIKAAGNNFMCSGTATCQIDSAAADATTSGTVGAFTLKPSVDIANSDLLLDVQDSAANHILTVTEAGAAVVAGSVTLGGGTAIVKVTSEQVDNQDIASAAANVCNVLAVSVAGATLGDSVICQSVQDDAAWDTGNLSCFVESAGVVKLQYCAGSAGGDPAAGNDYRFTLLRF